MTSQTSCALILLATLALGGCVAPRTLGTGPALSATDITACRADVLLHRQAKYEATMTLRAAPSGTMDARFAHLQYRLATVALSHYTAPGYEACWVQ